MLDVGAGAWLVDAFSRDGDWVFRRGLIDFFFGVIDFLRGVIDFFVFLGGLLEIFRGLMDFLALLDDLLGLLVILEGGGVTDFFSRLTACRFSGDVERLDDDDDPVLVEDVDEYDRFLLIDRLRLSDFLGV